MEIQQSPLFGDYMTRLKWTVETVDGVRVFIRKFPLVGGMMKIHRPQCLPTVEKLTPILRSYRVKTVVIEPEATQREIELRTWLTHVSAIANIHKGTPFLPTKTIHIDLRQTESKIFKHFSEAKRRGVRRAIKHGVIVRQSKDIHTFIKTKNTSAGLFGFITTTGLRQLWEVFAPKHATILLAYAPHRPSSIHHSSPIAGILLLFWDNIAYYWIAGATKEGKKLFAPTLLAWEAIKESKRRGCTMFDFVGMWDERIPKQNKQWHGFTRFKSGFGGSSIYYPITASLLNEAGEPRE